MLPLQVPSLPVYTNAISSLMIISSSQSIIGENRKSTEGLIIFIFLPSLSSSSFLSPHPPSFLSSPSATFSSSPSPPFGPLNSLIPVLLYLNHLFCIVLFLFLLLFLFFLIFSMPTIAYHSIYLSPFVLSLLLSFSLSHYLYTSSFSLFYFLPVSFRFLSFPLTLHSLFNLHSYTYMSLYSLWSPLSIHFYLSPHYLWSFSFSLSIHPFSFFFPFSLSTGVW